MAYIESHQELRAHPKLKKAARSLGIAPACLVGHLHFLWWWALDYAQDGSLGGYADDDIADAAGWDGDPGDFIDALVGCGLPGRSGFLDVAEDGDATLSIHDWWEYGGKLIAKRRADAERKRTQRHPTDVPAAPAPPQPDIPRTAAAPKADVQRTSNGHPTDIRGMSQVEKSRVEKSRVEHTLRAPASASADVAAGAAVLGDEWVGVLEAWGLKQTDLPVYAPDFFMALMQVAPKRTQWAQAAQWWDANRPPQPEVLVAAMAWQAQGGAEWWNKAERYKPGPFTWLERQDWKLPRPARGPTMETITADTPRPLTGATQPKNGSVSNAGRVFPDMDPDAERALLADPDFRAIRDAGPREPAVIERRPDRAAAVAGFGTARSVAAIGGSLGLPGVQGAGPGQAG